MRMVTQHYTYKILCVKHHCSDARFAGSRHKYWVSKKDLDRWTKIAEKEGRERDGSEFEDDQFGQEEVDEDSSAEPKRKRHRLEEIPATEFNRELLCVHGKFLSSFLIIASDAHCFLSLRFRTIGPWW